jgi:hypothetical protein
MDSTRLYWANGGAQNLSDGSISTLPKGAPTHR